MTDHNAKILAGLNNAEFVVTREPQKIFVEYAHLRGSVELGELSIFYGLNADKKEWFLKSNGDANGAMEWALEQTKAEMLKAADRARKLLSA